MTHTQKMLVQRGRDRLREISFSNNQPDNEDRDCYMGEYRNEVYGIGEILNQCGGFALMQQVAMSVPVKFEYDRHELNYAWDGVGDWRS
jgi:hypothetical protein